MNDIFKIYFMRLRDGEIEEIDETVSGDALQISEKELSFPYPVKIKGKAYLTQDHLILNLDLTTKAIVPCAICNDSANIEIGVKNIYNTTPLDDLKKGVYDYLPTVREAILLEIPPFSECHAGSCPSRDQLQKYIKKTDEDHYHPFNSLTGEN